MNWIAAGISAMMAFSMVSCQSAREKQGLSGSSDPQLSPNQPSTLEGESRGVWLARPNLLESKQEILARLDRLQAAGFNTVYVLTQARGYAIYPGSAILPQDPEFAVKHPDLLGWLVPAIKERGMRVEAWPEYGFMAFWKSADSTDPSRGPILDRYPNLVAVDHDGKDHDLNKQWGKFYWMCPSNPVSHEILLSLYSEMLDRYPFDGLNLDRVRYTNEKFCHCEGYCKLRFRESNGYELGKFAKGSKKHEQFVQWRKARLTQFVRQLSERLRSEHPHIQITSAVASPDAIDEKSQDWPAWMNSGYLDAVMPMLYDANPQRHVQWIRSALKPGSMVFYGIATDGGYDAFSERARNLRSLNGGLTVWHAGTVDEYLPQVGSQLFKDRVESPLNARASTTAQSSSRLAE